MPPVVNLERDDDLEMMTSIVLFFATPKCVVQITPTRWTAKKKSLSHSIEREPRILLHHIIVAERIHKDATKSLFTFPFSHYLLPRLVKLFISLDSFEILSLLK